MKFMHWLVSNFGLFFGPLFLLYIFFMIKRIIVLHDLLRHVPGKVTMESESDSLFAFLSPLFSRLRQAVTSGSGSHEPVIDAIWSEIDSRIGVHFVAVNGYVNTLILLGFAGTIFGSIGAFNEMFQGLARGENGAAVFAASWNNGLATALYTSLGAAVIGGCMVTVLCSRLLMTRARHFDTLVGLKIADILEDDHGRTQASDCTS